MVRVHKALEGRDAKLILQVHDELVVECAEGIADEVAALVRRGMVSGFRKLFPDAPRRGLVDIRVGRAGRRHRLPTRQAGRSVGAVGSGCRTPARDPRRQRPLPAFRHYRGRWRP